LLREYPEGLTISFLFLAVLVSSNRDSCTIKGRDLAAFLAKGG